MEEVELDKGGNRVGQIVSKSHLDNGLVLDVAYVVLDNPYNDSKGLDGNFDLHDSYLNLDDVEYQFDMEL